MNLFEVSTLGNNHIAYKDVDFVHLDRKENTEFELLIIDHFYQQSAWI